MKGDKIYNCINPLSICTPVFIIIFGFSSFHFHLHVTCAVRSMRTDFYVLFLVNIQPSL
jgi:hypothetical protein